MTLPSSFLAAIPRMVNIATYKRLHDHFDADYDVALVVGDTPRAIMMSLKRYDQLLRYESQVIAAERLKEGTSVPVNTLEFMRIVSE